MFWQKRMKKNRKPRRWVQMFTCSPNETDAVKETPELVKFRRTSPFHCVV